MSIMVQDIGTSRERESNIISYDTFDRNQIPTSGPSVTSYFEKNTADLLYVEQMVPREGDGENIYWSGCNFFFDRRSGYAGIQHQANKIIDGVPFLYNNICSIWDLEDTDSNLPTEAKLTYAREGLHSSHFGGEGTGLHTSHPMPWSPDQWYATVIRRWYIPGEKVTRVAMFMYSYSDEQWIHYMSVAIPEVNIPLTGNFCSGFLERFVGDALGYFGVYGQHFRMDKNGDWEKPIYYTAEAGGNPNYWKAELYQNGYIKLTAGGIFDNEESNIRLDPGQRDSKPKPVIPPFIKWIDAFYDDRTKHFVIVEWKNADNTPPQLSYSVEIRKDTLSGILISEETNMIPEQRKAKIETGPLKPGKYYAIVQFKDIFNQESNLSSMSFIVPEFEDWNLDTVYRTGSVVSWERKNWIAKVTNTGIEPGMNDEVWREYLFDFIKVIIEGPKEVRSEQEVVLSAEKSKANAADIVSYVWQVPHGIKVDSLNQPTLSLVTPYVDKAQEILISVTVTDALGNSNNSSYTLLIMPLPKLKIWPWDSSVLCNKDNLVVWKDKIWKARTVSQGWEPGTDSRFWIETEDYKIWNSKIVYSKSAIVKWENIYWEARQANTDGEPGSNYKLWQGVFEQE